MEMAADELDLEVWQDLERDPAVRARLRQMIGEDDDEQDWSWGIPWMRSETDKKKARFPAESRCETDEE